MNSCRECKHILPDDIRQAFTTEVPSVVRVYYKQNNTLKYRDYCGKSDNDAACGQYEAPR